MIWWIMGAVLLAVGLWLLLKDTMNRIQYIQTIRLYWVTRDVGSPTDPHIKKAWMRHTEAPFWRGKGVEFRWKKYTFQVGVLTKKGKDLQDQLSNLPGYEPTLEEIRGWH